MSLKRLLKLLAAFLMGQGVTVISQLLIPPFFLLRYGSGVEVYGEWVALTAAVSYLNSLNYGIQNYANNQMAILYHRDELDQAKAVQANALRLILIAILALSLLGSVAFFLPLARLLSLRHTSSSAASLTIFLMILQLSIGWLFSLISSSYLVIGQAHRGQSWANGQRLFFVLTMAAFLWNRASFPVLALTQLVTTVAFLVFVIVDVRVHAPILLPSLRFGSMKTMVSIMKPSGYFGLLAVSAFLCWQGPVLIIEKLLGPASVAIFSLSRVVFNLSRMILITLTMSISQDITLLFGQKNWAGLRRLYDLSERVVLFLIPTITVGTLLMCPVLFALWLHKRTLYDPGMCLLMAAISAVMGIKEHKYQFQVASNEHQSISRFSLAAYSSMLLLSAFTLKTYGIESFLYIWLATEVVQTAYILSLNFKLFPPDAHLSATPVLRLFAILAISLAASAWPAYHSVQWPLAIVAAVAIGFTLALAAISYSFFGLKEVRSVLEGRFRRRFAVG
jgi:O-antigen/teichoic acid export membrane protein